MRIQTHWVGALNQWTTSNTKYGDRTKWSRTKWHGQNGTTKWYTDKMVWDKMVWTKWYGQNGTDKMVVIFGIDYNSREFNSYLVTKIHNEMINTQRKAKRLKVEAGLMKKSYCQWQSTYCID